jgi:hypothetical protein
MTTTKGSISRIKVNTAGNDKETNSDQSNVALKDMYFTNYSVDFYTAGKTYNVPVLPDNGNSNYFIREIIKVDDAGYIKPSFHVEQGTVETAFVKTRSLLNVSFTYDTILNLFKVDSAMYASQDVVVGYQTGKTSAIAYEYTDSNGNLVHPPLPPDDLPYLVRRYPPSTKREDLIHVSAHEAIPVVSKEITEVFNNIAGNIITLRSIPFVDYSNYEWNDGSWKDGIPPLTVKIFTNEDDHTGTIAKDRTIWSDRKQQPKLDPKHPDSSSYEYFIYKNRIAFNVTRSFRVEATYTSKAEAFNVRIDMHTLNKALTPIVEHYEVDIYAQ